MSDSNLSQMSGLNECSSCKSWKANQGNPGNPGNLTINTLPSAGHLGLCTSGGFDGSYTQSNETCSMWKPLIDKARISPIFHPKASDH